MSVLLAIVFGIIQGVAEFFPVSSAGQVTIMENLLNVNQDTALLFEAMLHIGTLFALFYVFKRDIRRIVMESVAMLLEVLINFRQFLLRKTKAGRRAQYKRIISSSYRRFVFMLVISMIPTALLGFLARNLAAAARTSDMMPGIFLLLNGVFLIVVDMSGAGGERTPRNAGYDLAVWTGICQGLSVFPGLSRCGLTVGAGLLCGFSRKMALKFSLLASIPAVIGAVIVEIPAASVSADLSGTTMLPFIAGAAAAAITGRLAVRWLIKAASQIRLRWFAVYSFIAGGIYLSMKL